MSFASKKHIEEQKRIKILTSICKEIGLSQLSTSVFQAYHLGGLDALRDIEFRKLYKEAKKEVWSLGHSATDKLQAFFHRIHRSL